MADEYERVYMGGEDVIARSRSRIPLWLHVPLAALVPLAIVCSFRVHGWRVPFFWGLAAFSTFFWLLNTHVRVTVTRTHVHVQHGVLGPSIALADVESVATAPSSLFDLIRHVGWGIGGFGFNRCYGYVTGASNGLVVIQHRHRGRLRKTLVSCEDPAALADAIRAAIAPVRVAAALPEAAESEAEADAEAELESVRPGSARASVSR